VACKMCRWGFAQQRHILGIWPGRTGEPACFACWGPARHDKVQLDRTLGAQVPCLPIRAKQNTRAMSGQTVLSGAAMLAASSAAAAMPVLALKADDLAYDLGLMAAFDPHPLDPTAFAADKEGTLAQLAQANTQLLVKRLFELPVEKTEVGPVVSCIDRALGAAPALHSGAATWAAGATIQVI
jgi:hypothetical protein